MNPQPLHPAEALFDKCIDQSLSPQEQAQLDAWVCADPRNAEALSRWLLAHAQTAEGLAMGLAMAPQVAGQVAGKVPGQVNGRVAGSLPRRKPAAGGMTPMLAAIGSTITAAISGPNAANAERTPARSLYGRLIVSLATPAETPALSGVPNVIAPEPALTSRLSAWPW